MDTASTLRYPCLSQFDLKPALFTDHLFLMDTAKQMEWSTPDMTEYGSVEKLTGTYGWFEDLWEEHFGGDAECEAINQHTVECTISYHGVS